MGIKHESSQEGSQSPSASATPRLSIQQDSHKRNVYHIYGKESEADFNAQQLQQSNIQKDNKPVAGAAPKRKPAGKTAIFGSQNGIRTAALNQKVPFVGKLTFDGASSTQNHPGPANRGLEFVSMPGRSARAHGLSGKQVFQMESCDAEGANLPRRKLLFSLGQQNINQNLIPGALAFNEVESATGPAEGEPPGLKRDEQRMKKTRKKATARLAHAKEEHLKSNAGPVDHSISQNPELLRSSATMLDMSEINQGVQYDQRGRGIKSTQSGPSRHATSSKVAWPIAGSLLAARRCHEATGNFFIDGSSYESVNNNFVNIAPSDIQYQIQSRDAVESLNEENVVAGAHDIDQESRTIFCSE